MLPPTNLIEIPMTCPETVTKNEEAPTGMVIKKHKFYSIPRTHSQSTTKQ